MTATTPPCEVNFRLDRGGLAFLTGHSGAGKYC